MERAMVYAVHRNIRITVNTRVEPSQPLRTTLGSNTSCVDDKLHKHAKPIHAENVDEPTHLRANLHACARYSKRPTVLQSHTA
eukprot:5200308-Pleurochrysis_carterae.AAC.3